MQSELNHGYSTIKFDAKPSAQVRDTLKTYGYRWSPAGGHWYAKANADKHLAATRAVTLAEHGTHGPCQKCGAATARYRRLGWNEPELRLCDKCCNASEWHPAPAPTADYSDTLYEDHCRSQCGL